MARSKTGTSTTARSSLKKTDSSVSESLGDKDWSAIAAIKRGRYKGIVCKSAAWKLPGEGRRELGPHRARRSVSHIWYFKAFGRIKMCWT
jgi:hypothetical protein